MRAKIFVPEIVLGVMLTIAVFAMGALYSSSRSALPNSSVSQQAPATISADKSFWDKAADDPVAYFTIWITLFTGVSVLSNVGLWLVTRATLRHGRDTAERELRAYVTTVHGVGIRQTRALRFEFRPFILNTGQTPAYNVNVTSSVAFLTNAEVATFDFVGNLPPLDILGVTTLGKGQDRFAQIVFARKLSRQELREYWKGEKFFVVFGTVTYDDAFARRRYTNFCYAVLAWNKRFPPVWRTVARYNESN